MPKLILSQVISFNRNSTEFYIYQDIGKYRDIVAGPFQTCEEAEKALKKLEGNHD